MKQYHDQLQYILDNGKIREDRTGVGTIGVFGMQTRYDLHQGFPAVTTKRLAWRSVVAELLWFLEGSTDERRLAEIQFGSRGTEKNTIWTANADEQGVALGYKNTQFEKQLGPVYGFQWRNWGGTMSGSYKGIDQISQLISDIKTNPTSRRLIVNAWNVEDIPDMALPPCHMMMQFYVTGDELSCQLYQRSADMFLGVPFNIASYSLMTHMIAQMTGLKVGEFVHTLGDAHIYTNHFDQVNEQLSREPRPLPTLQIPAFQTLDEALSTQVSDYQLIGYDPHPAIKADMAV